MSIHTSRKSRLLGPRDLIRRWRWALLAALAMATVVGTWLGTGVREATALGTPSPQIIIAVDVGNNGSTDCDTDTGTTGIGAKCSANVGATFTVDVRLNNLVGLPNNDADAKSGYNSFDHSTQFSAGLTYVDRAGLGEVVGPQCGIKAENTSLLPGEVEHACVFGGANEMTFLGTVFELDVSCASAGARTVTLVHGGPTNTHVTDDDTNIVNDNNDNGAPETLTINCETATPTPTATVPPPPPTPGPVGGISFDPAGGQGSSGLGSWYVAAVSAAAGVVALGAAWYARRRMTNL